MLVTVVDDAFDDEADVTTLARSSSVDSRLSRAEPNDELLMSSPLKKSSGSKHASPILAVLLSSGTVDETSLASSWIVSASRDFVDSITEQAPKYFRMRMAALSSGIPDVSSTDFSFFSPDGADGGACIDWMVERSRPQLLALLTLDAERTESALDFLPRSGRDSNVCTSSRTWCCSTSVSSTMKQPKRNLVVITPSNTRPLQALLNARSPSNDTIT